MEPKEPNVLLTIKTDKVEVSGWYTVTDALERIETARKSGVKFTYTMSGPQER